MKSEHAQVCTLYFARDALGGGFATEAAASGLACGGF